MLDQIPYLNYQQLIIFYVQHDPEKVRSGVEEDDAMRCDSMSGGERERDVRYEKFLGG